MVSAPAEKSSDANASAAIILRIDLILTNTVQENENRGQHRLPPIVVRDLLRGDLLLAVSDAPDGAVPVVGDQERSVLHLHHIDRPPDILVVFEEASDQRLDVLDRAVLVEMDGDNVTAELVGLVPGAVPGHDRDVLVALREHAAGIEPHAERGCVRPHQADGWREFAAGMAPAEFGIGDIALPAVRRAAVLTDLGDAIELVIRK